MSHFKSILLTALLGASACVPAWAAETKPLTIIIDRIGADPIEITVSTSTTITFADGNAVISDDKAGTQTIPLEDLANINFESEIASVDETEIAFDSGVTIKSANGLVTIEPGEAGAFVYAAFSIEGRMVCQGQSPAAVTIDFTSLPTGVYVIVANNKTLKFINR